MRQLFIDLDGVLADFDGFYEEKFGYRPNRLSTENNPEEDKRLWENIYSVDRFYASLPVMPDAMRLWLGALEIHPNPIILTGISKRPGCAEEKREWVAKYIDKFAKVICCFSKDKRDYGIPGDVLIDDWIKYKSRWEHMGGIFILHKDAESSLEQARSVFSYDGVR